MITNSQRWTVYYLFMYKYNGMSPTDGVDLYEYWNGKNGIARKIRQDLGLSCQFKKYR